MRGILISIAVVAVAYLSVPYIWKYYVAPQSDLETVLKRCELQGDKIYGLEIVRWREAHNSDAGNDFRRARDRYIETCAQADGWCSIKLPSGDLGDWPNTYPNEFAPRDALARRLYFYRYGWQGDRVNCY